MQRFSLLLPVALVLIVFSFFGASEGPDYDKDLLSAEFHAGRREALRNLMPDSTVAVFSQRRFIRERMM